MKRSFLCAFLTAGILQAGSAADSQIERGRQLFLNSPRGSACATCHSLEGKGTPAGPDLTRLAAVIGPRGLVMTIQMSMTAYVQEVHLKDGRKFPGIQKGEENGGVTLFDLSQTPPAELKVKAGAIASQTPNTKWKHPPSGAGYSDAELADIIAYLKFAATGVVREVAVSELR